MIIDSAVVCNGVSVSTQTMLVERGELAIYKRTDTRIQYSPSQHRNQHQLAPQLLFSHLTRQQREHGAENEGSRRFHNHGGGPYLGLLLVERFHFAKRAAKHSK